MMVELEMFPLLKCLFQGLDDLQLFSSLILASPVRMNIESIRGIHRSISEIALYQRLLGAKTKVVHDLILL
jgi:hypothetical protein